MTKATCVLLVSVAALCTLAAAQTPPPQDEKQAKKAAATVVINIVLKDGKYLYVKEGETEQKPVVVNVGQSVVWKNRTDDTHTATSNRKGPDGKRLFRIRVKPQDEAESASKPQLFGEAMYKNAKGTPGGEVTLDYFCEPHKRIKMGSRIILKSEKAQR